MGWRERDWAELNAAEQRELYGSGTSPRRPTPSLLLAIAVSLFCTLVLGGSVFLQRLAPHVPAPMAVSVPTFSATAEFAAAPPNTVIVHWSPSDLVPAATHSGACVSVGGQTPLCSDFPRGRRPADVIVELLHDAGLQVASAPADGSV